jgi:hypothetical protein
MEREKLGDIGIDSRIILISQNTRCEDIERLQLAEIVSIGWFFEHCNRPSRSV